MKCFILLLCIFIAKAQSKTEKSYAEACLAEVGINKDDLAPASDEKMECYRTCLWKKRGVLRNGKIDPEAVFDMQKRTTRMGLGALREKINSCVATANKETEECKVPAKLRQCMEGNQKMQKK